MKLTKEQKLKSLKYIYCSLQKLGDMSDADHLRKELVKNLKP